MTATVGYATLQIIPSVRGIANEIRQQLAPAAGEGERAGGETGRSFGEGFKHILEAAGIMTAVEKITEGISEAFSESIDQAGVPGRLRAQLGASGPVAAQLGDVAGKLYAQGITDSVETGAEDVRAIVSSGLVPPKATIDQLTSISTKVSDVASTFDQELGGVSTAVGQFIKTGLVKDANTGLDLVTKAFQSVGPNGADDLLDTMNEYAVQFQGLGLSGPQAMGLIVQSMQGGARNTDLAADSLKEFRVRAVNLTDTNAQAGFKALGLNAKQMAKDVAAGGPAATSALQQTIDKLRAIPNPAKQATIAGMLFGTQSEDMAKALLKIDPSKATASLGQFSGAASQMGNDLRDNAGARLTAFTRGLKQGLVQVIGGQVLPRLLSLATTVQSKVGPPLTRIGRILSRDVGPAMDTTGRFIVGTLVPGLIAAAAWTQRNSTTLEIVAGVITALLLPLLITLGVQYTVAGAAAVVSGAQQTAAWVATQAGAVKSAALQVVASYRTVGGWIASGAAATAAGAKVVAGWAVSGASAVAGAVTQTISTGEVVAGWVLMGVQSLLQAARMAAAWLIALGPIGWITIAVVAIAALIIANWSRISSWTVSIWHAIVGWVTAAASAVLGFLRSHWPLILAILTGPIGLAVLLITKYWSKISAGFRSAYRATVGVGASLIGWVTGLPGRVGRALISLGVKVYSVVSAGFSRAKTAASAEGAKLLAYAAGLPGQIKTKVGKLGSLLYSVGQDLVRGLLHGMSSMAGQLAKQAAGMGKTALKSVKGALGIHSPSRAMAEVGRQTGAGLIVGLDRQRGAVEDAMRRLVIIPPAPTGPALAAATASSAPAGRGPARTPVRLVVDGHEFTAYLEEVADERVDQALTTVRRTAGARGPRR